MKCLTGLLLVVLVATCVHGATDPLCSGTTVSSWATIANHNYGATPTVTFCLDDSFSYTGSVITIASSANFAIVLWGASSATTTINCGGGCGYYMSFNGWSGNTVSFTFKQLTFANSNGTIEFVDTNAEVTGTLLVQDVVYTNVRNLDAGPSYAFGSLFRVLRFFSTMTFNNVVVTGGSPVSGGSTVTGSIVSGTARAASTVISITGSSFQGMCGSNVDSLFSISGSSPTFGLDLDVINSDFTNNDCQSGVFNFRELPGFGSGTTVDIVGSDFVGCFANAGTQHAGVLTLTSLNSGANVNVQDSTFVNGGGRTAGVIALANTATTSPAYAVSVTGGSCTGNTAGVGDGGCFSFVGFWVADLTGVSVSSNTASNGNGGAIFMNPTTNAASSLTLTNVNASNNVAGDEGGAIYFQTSTAATFTAEACTISGNSADNAGGGLLCGASVDCFVGDSVMNSNTGSNGGAISAYQSVVDVDNTTIMFNAADTVGGGLNCFSSTCVVSYSTFDSNSASSGGAMYALFTGADLRIDNSYIARNTEGALVSFLAALLQVTDSVLFENVGAAIDALQSEVALSGLIVRANQATSGAVQVAGAANPVYVNDSFIGTNEGYGFVCGDADVRFHDTTVCNSNIENLQCNFACTLEITVDSVLVSTDDCAVGPTGNVSFSRPCEEACSEDTVCVRSHFPFAGPFDGCFLCGSPCLEDGLNECAQAAVCEDMADSPFYNCSCITGYVGNGTDCQDFDECEASNGTLCIGESTCVDTDGSYFCDCPDGEIADANGNCDDENECDRVVPPCSGFATCANAVGAPFFTCTCNAGYYGDGITCTACAANRTSAAGSTALDDCECATDPVVTYPNIADVNDASLPCQACEAGYSVYQQQCQPCAASYYSETVNAAECVACPGTYVSPAQSTSQSACVCQDGYVPEDDQVAYSPCVIECDPGTYRLEGACQDCGIGRFSNIANLAGDNSGSPCDACPFATTTTSGTSTTVNECVCITDLPVPDDSPAYPFWQSFSFAPVDVTDPSDGCIIQCPVGSYRNADDSTECSPCPVNTYQDQTNQDNCAACPFASSTEGLLASTNVSACVCDSGFVYDAVEGCTRQCLPGTYYVGEEAPCVTCGENFWSGGINDLACTPCPPNNVAPGASTTIEACQCAEGYYTPEGTVGTECLICPAGGTCLGGVSTPIAEPGYTPVEDENGAVTFQECVPRSACVGDGKCAVGYVGEICNECDSAYDQCANEPDMERCGVVKYYRLNGVCKECKSNAGLLVFGVYVALVALQVILIWLNLQERVLNRFASLNIGVNSLQMAGQYGRLEIDWPPLAKAFFDILSIANFNLELVAPECAVPVGNPFVLRWLGTMFFPILIAANFGLIYVVVHALVIVLTKLNSPFVARMPTARVFRHTAIRSMYQLMMIVYLPLSAATFELFDCPKDSNGVRVVNVARDMECFKGVYWVLFPFGLVFIFLYPIGMPLFYYRLLKTKLTGLGPVKFYIRYGFLVGRFSENFYLFELLIMARKLGVVLAMSFLTASPYVKAGGAIIVLQFALWLHLETTPYRTLLYNVIETICLMCLIFVLLISMLFADESFVKAAREGTVLPCLLILVVTIATGVGLDSYFLYKGRGSGGPDDDVTFRAASHVDNSSGVADEKSFDAIAMKDFSSSGRADSMADKAPLHSVPHTMESVDLQTHGSALPNHTASTSSSKEAPPMPDGHVMMSNATVSPAFTGSVTE